MSQQQAQPLTSQTGQYSSPSYNPAYAAAGAPQYDAGVVMPPTKM